MERFILKTAQNSPVKIQPFFLQNDRSITLLTKKFSWKKPFCPISDWIFHKMIYNLYSALGVVYLQTQAHKFAEALRALLGSSQSLYTRDDMQRGNIIVCGEGLAVYYCSVPTWPPWFTTFRLKFLGKKGGKFVLAFFKFE